MNAESGRAWLGTRFATIAQPLTKGQGLQALIQYTSTGKESAKETERLGVVLFFTQRGWVNGVAVEKLVSLQRQYLSRQDSTVHGISFPTSGDNAYGINVDSNSEDIPEKSRLVVADDVISGSALAVISGCLAYESEGAIRHTAFCYSYQASRAPKGAFVYCTVDNDAD